MIVDTAYSVYLSSCVNCWYIELVFVSRLGYAVTRIIVVISTWIIVGYFSLASLMKPCRNCNRWQEGINRFLWFIYDKIETHMFSEAWTIFFVVIDSSGKPGIGLFKVELFTCAGFTNQGWCVVLLTCCNNSNRMFIWVRCLDP